MEERGYSWISLRWEIHHQLNHRRLCVPWLELWFRYGEFRSELSFSSNTTKGRHQTRPIPHRLLEIVIVSMKPDEVLPVSYFHSSGNSTRRSAKHFLIGCNLPACFKIASRFASMVSNTSWYINELQCKTLFNLWNEATPISSLHLQVTISKATREVSSETLIFSPTWQDLVTILY